MNYFDIKKIKKEIITIDPKKWWGDDFDVRFFLISKIIKFENKKILDAGGSIGIILSNMNQNNKKINLDISFEDLLISKNQNKKNIENICASMTNLPFREKYFDYVIAADILEYAKENDLNNKESKYGFVSINKTVNEMYRVVKEKGTVFFTTPNNEYYKTEKLTYNELKNSIKLYFPEFKIFFFNTYPKLHEKYRKLNMANTIPKLLSKIKKRESIINSLCKRKSQNNYSVSFYVEASKTIQ